MWGTDRRDIVNPTEDAAAAAHPSIYRFRGLQERMAHTHTKRGKRERTNGWAGITLPLSLAPSALLSSLLSCLASSVLASKKERNWFRVGAPFSCFTHGKRKRRAPCLPIPPSRHRSIALPPPSAPFQFRWRAKWKFLCGIKERRKIRLAPLRRARSPPPRCSHI